jgi:hypothetical protein
VFYRNGVTEDEAASLADWLVAAGYFDSITPKSVQLERGGDTCHIRFVIKNEFREEPRVERFMLLVAYEVSHRINRNGPAVAHICNDRFKPLESVPLRIRRDDCDLVYSSRISPDQAVLLEPFICHLSLTGPTVKPTVFLDQNLNRYLVSYVADPGIGADDGNRERVTQFAKSVSEQILGSAPVDFYFVDTLLTINAAPVYFAGN